MTDAAAPPPLFDADDAAVQKQIRPEDVDPRAARLLWLTVLHAGLWDAKRGASLEDVDWIGSEDFRLVCDLGGLDGDHLQRVGWRLKAAAQPRSRRRVQKVPS